MATFMFLEVLKLTSTGEAYRYITQVSDIIQICLRFCLQLDKKGRVGGSEIEVILPLNVNNKYCKVLCKVLDCVAPFPGIESLHL